MTQRFGGIQRFVRALLAASCAVGLLMETAAVQAQVAPAAEFAVEGPISAIDPVAGTITAQGMTVVVPADLVLGGTSGITGATLNRLLDTNAPGRVRSIFGSTTENPGYTGGTLKGAGVIERTANGRVFRLTEAVVELAENVLAGELDSVDVANNSFVINGVNCKMNPDQRFPSEILDAGAEPITINDLATQIGGLITVVGYFHNGIQYAVTVETEVVPTTPGSDTVRITRAEGRNRDRNRSELKVLGIVTPFEAGVNITITDPSNGAVLGVVPVVQDAAIPTQGTFQLRRTNLAATPARVRATSTNGGVHEADVTIR